MEFLTIKIPWKNFFNGTYEVEVRGLYMLVVPTSSLGYDQEREEKEQQEAKMAKIAAIEEAKQRDRDLADIKVTFKMVETVNQPTRTCG